MAETEQQCMEIKLSVPWGHVAAKTYGSPTGKPVLLVHGHQDNLGSFTRLMKYLPKELFYYVCIDLPGHGWSSPFPSWMMIDITVYTHGLYFILEALQWKKFIYIGHSLGTQIAFMFSIFQPNRIRKLISLDGLLMGHLKEDYVLHFYITSTLVVKTYHKTEKPRSYTKTEILHALKTMRMSPLNSEAADALFERAVTKINGNGKYIYNRDLRLRHQPLLFMNMEECQKFNNKLSVPIYLFLPSHGVLRKHEEELKLVLETIKTKTMLEIINIDGNHDVHNNNPENIAPFVCEILNSDNFSKL
ncbi:serine hydrolase-like protein [Temnothorax curvispinosus]|uniref:Serine hydrolase-like protein n=1 Tax=Temnothorax curvispinosus TaxID=300111 RepID=A0A6J1QNK0_9HYME|nr:serine hydrolase-like protein [Temnothorax curvispinosus]XP_024882587.1 serine hydrolase-like protein [Temnothorax curvispinosus]